MDAGIERGLCHEQTNQVVGQQMYPHLFLVHLRRLITEHVHAQGRFDVAQVELHVPAQPVQPGQFGFSNPAVIEHRGDQDWLAIDFDFPHGELIGKALIVLVRLDENRHDGRHYFRHGIPRMTKIWWGVSDSNTLPTD